MRVKRAGFKPSLNLLYALEGALLDCHWQEVPEERRSELVQAAEAAIALLPPPRNRPAASPCTTTMMHEEPHRRCRLSSTSLITTDPAVVRAASARCLRTDSDTRSDRGHDGSLSGQFLRIAYTAPRFEVTRRRPAARVETGSR